MPSGFFLWFTQKIGVDICCSLHQNIKIGWNTMALSYLHGNQTYWRFALKHLKVVWVLVYRYVKLWKVHNLHLNIKRKYFQLPSKLIVYIFGNKIMFLLLIFYIAIKFFLFFIYIAMISISIDLCVNNELDDFTLQLLLLLRSMIKLFIPFQNNFYEKTQSNQ